MSNDKHEKNIIDYLLPTAYNEGGDGTNDATDINTVRQIRAFIDEIPGGFLIYRADKSEEIVYANKALLNIFKCNNFEEFMALTHGTFRGVVHTDDLERVEREISNQIRFNNTSLDYVEYRIVRKDGIVRWVEDYGHYIPGDSDASFFYVFISDATEKLTRQIAERAALVNDEKEKEKQLQNIIEEYDKERSLIRQEHLQRLEVIEGLSANYDSIIYANIEQNIALPYRLSTRLVHQFTKRLEVRELSWFLDEYVKVWVHPDDRKYVAERTSIDFIRSALSDQKTYYINYRCIQNGETQYLQLRIVNVGSEGDDVKQIVMGYRNIDEEVLQEMRQEQLLEAALTNAKMADVAKNTFLSNMSHDMRTPLNALFGYLKLAREADTRDTAVQYLDKIETAGNNLLELVDKVLELSDAQSRDYTLTEDPFNVVDVIDQTYSVAAEQAKNKGVTLSLNADAITDGFVLGDKDKLTKILANIMDNAVKYTKSGGWVSVSVSQKTGLQKLMTIFTFEVKDNGIGISKSMQKRIFDPFIRDTNTTESGVFGAGLGLTITKQLVDAMHGAIRVESALGKGSTFTVTLGFKPDVSHTKQAADEKPDLNGKKILIVEDNEINLEIETEILQDYGLIIDSAENGQIAVDKIKAAGKSDYDLVLMDIQMPVMDGRTATREIRKLKGHPLSDIPIIALSANALESDRRASLEAGMDAHLFKPLDVDLLIGAIGTAFKLRR